MTDEHFRARLKELREARGWSQALAGERAGVDYTMVSRLESGTRNPTREMLDKLALGLGLTGPEYDQLLILAGLLPIDPAATIDDEPVVAALYRALRGDALTDERKDSLRVLVAAALTLTGA